MLQYNEAYMSKQSLMLHQHTTVVQNNGDVVAGARRNYRKRSSTTEFGGGLFVGAKSSAHSSLRSDAGDEND